MNALFILYFSTDFKDSVEEKQAKEIGMLQYKKAVLMYAIQSGKTDIDTDVIDSIYNAECK